MANRYVTYGLYGYDESKIEREHNKYVLEKYNGFTEWLDDKSGFYGGWTPKPSGGLWASPDGDDSFGWKSFNEENLTKMDERNKTTFELSDDAKVLLIDSDEKVNWLKENYRETVDGREILDFNKLSKDFDAMEVHIFEENVHQLMYGYDCDSICIFDPEKINIIEDRTPDFASMSNSQVATHIKEETILGDAVGRLYKSLSSEQRSCPEIASAFINKESFKRAAEIDRDAYNKAMQSDELKEKYLKRAIEDLGYASRRDWLKEEIVKDMGEYTPTAYLKDNDVINKLIEHGFTPNDYNVLCRERNVEPIREYQHEHTHQTLYRGMRFDREQFENYRFQGDLTPPPDYVMKDGVKCVTDGNEYGIYMSTNKNMVEDAYGDVGLHDCTPLSGDRMAVGMDRCPVGMPSISVVMEIDTNGLDIKEPWIDPQLKGHYNNGYQGQELISREAIPITNISYSNVIIGPDLLHNKTELGNMPASKIHDVVKRELEGRERSLERMHEFLSKEDPNTLLRMDIYSYQDSFQKMFNERCLEKTKFDLSARDGVKKFLLAGTNIEKEGQLDLKDVRSIQRAIDGKIGDEEPFRNAVEEIRRGSSESCRYCEQFVSGYTSFTHRMEQSGFDIESTDFKRTLLEEGMRQNGRERMEVYVSTMSKEKDVPEFSRKWGREYVMSERPWHRDDLKIYDRDFERLGITGQMREEVTKELLRAVINDETNNSRRELTKRAPAIARCLNGH